MALAKQRSKAAWYERRKTVDDVLLSACSEKRKACEMARGVAAAGEAKLSS